MILTRSPPRFLLICLRRSEAILSLWCSLVDPAFFPWREAALAASFSMMPAHSENTKDKQVSQVNATEILVLFIDLTSVTFSNLIGPQNEGGRLPFGMACAKPKGIVQYTELTRFRGISAKDGFGLASQSDELRSN